MAIVNLTGTPLPLTTATANTTYVQDAGVTHDKDVTLIDLKSTANLRFEINGNMLSDVSILKYGEGLGASAAFDLHVGEEAFLKSTSQALAIAGAGSTVVNEGWIESVNSNAIVLTGAGTRFENAGTLIGKGQTVLLNGDNFNFINTGAIRGDSAVSVTTSEDSEARIVNKGDLFSTSWAIIGDDGSETVINSGHIHNGIILGDGDDRFIDKGGMVDNIVSGGNGDDFFLTRSTELTFTESTSGGFDIVHSSVDWQLRDNFESARLIGKNNVDLTGNDGGSFLYGNKANNRIIGEAGLDWIDGGKGQDRLTGDGIDNMGDVTDHFVFKNGYGRDVITDFQDGVDFINLQNYEGIDTIGDLKGHIKQDGDNVVITLQDGDRITLLDFDRSNLTGADFSF
jgi:Ca2+-binding RTX toxin-like protein